MSLSPNSAPCPTEDAATAYARDAQHHRAILNEMVDLAADMARLVHQQTAVQARAAPGDAGEPSPAVAKLGMVFDRIVRGIRRSVLLAAKLTKPVPIAAPARPRDAARQRIIRGVEDAIQREVDGADAEALQDELLDRLDSPDLEDDLGDRPVGEIIAEICRDLGLGRAPGSHAWARRTPADLAVLRARAAAAPAERMAGAGVPVAGAGTPVAGDTPPQGGAPLLADATRCRGDP